MKTSIVVSSGTTVVRANTDEQLIGLWLRSHAASAATLETYGIAIRQFRDFTGHTPLQQLKLEDLLSYREHLAEVYGSKASQALKLNAVKSLLTFGQKVGYLQFNVGVAVDGVKVPDTLAERILTEAQVILMVNHPKLSPRNRLLIRLLYVSGGRVGEIVNLQWRHVQQSGDSGQITVTGKGGKTRAIRLSVDTWTALQEYRPTQAQPSDYVFQSQRKGGGRRLDTTTVLRIVRQAGVLIGVPDVSPHWFRHSHASHALDNGAPISLVKETLGHSSVATTSRYLHVRPGESSSQKLKL